MHPLALFAQTMSMEAALIVAVGTLAGIVVMLWTKGEKENARLMKRADQCEAEHKLCQPRYAELHEKLAVLSTEVGHLREKTQPQPQASPDTAQSTKPPPS